VVAWVLHSSFPVRQASFPPRALVLVIRMEGLGAAARWTKETFALAPEVCMTLIEVKQRSKGRVKTECSAAEVIDCPCRLPFDAGTKIKAFEPRIYLSFMNILGRWQDWL
jgi:hypothetical protein